MGKVAKENVCLSKRKDGERDREDVGGQRKRMFAKLQVCVSLFFLSREFRGRTAPQGKFRAAGK